jgi:hypothetical protein
MTSTSVILEDEQHKIIDDYFYDEPDLPWVPLPVHTFEQTPCNVIISQILLSGSNSGYYYCKLHSEICYCPIHHLDIIEHHHCKYNKEPEKQESKILEILNGGFSSK